MNDRLYRSRDDRVIGGVASGLADYVGLDATLVRVLWVVLTVMSGGAFVLIYLAMLLIVPEEPAIPPAVAGTVDPAGSPGTVPDWRALRAADRARRRAERARARAEGGGGMRTDRGPIVLGIVLVLLGTWFLLNELFPELDLGRFWPVILIAFGLTILVSAVRTDRIDRGGSPRP